MCDTNMVFHFLYNDKKNRGGKITFILVEKIGEVKKMEIEIDAMLRSVFEEIKTYNLVQ